MPSVTSFPGTIASLNPAAVLTAQKLVRADRLAGWGGRPPLRLYDRSILRHESRSDTVLLNTSAPGDESWGSTQK